MAQFVRDEDDGGPGGTEPGDAELITAAREGDSAAFGELYRRHSSAAYGLARQLANSPSQADDLVSDAFAKVLEALRAGRGPDVAFRAYLLTTLRHGLYDRTRRDRKLRFSDDLSSIDPGVPFEDTAASQLEATIIAQAFAALPERWQAVLWHTEVEGQKPAEVAALLGLTPNGAAALAYRAREGLRQAYLQAHLNDAAEDSCRYTVERLGARTRSALSRREQTKVEEHLAGCDRCSAMAGELADLNGGLRAILAPLVLGAPFVAGYLASLGGGGLTVTSTGGAAATAPAGTPPPGTSPPTAASAGRGASGPARVLIGAGAVVAAAAIAVGVAFGVGFGGDEPSTDQAAITSSIGPAGQPSATRSGSSASGSASAAPSTTTGPTPSSSAPVASAPSTAPTPSDGSSEPRSGASARPPSGPSTSVEPEPTEAVPPVPAALSVPVSVTFMGQSLSADTLYTDAAGTAPQLRVSNLPAGWTASLSGPCTEGGGVVCTLTTGGGTAPTVTLALSSTGSPSGGTAIVALLSDAGGPVADSRPLSLSGS